MVAPMGGGGGGDIKVFAPFPLQAGEFDVMPDDPSPVTLSLSDIPSFPYMFTMTCQQAGLFDLTFTIPYSVTEASGSQDRAAIYTVLFACPQSATVWGIGGLELQKMNQIVFQNGEYVVQQP